MVLQRVVLGLLRRCRVRVYLGISELNPRGREEQGPLLEWVQRMRREVALTPNPSPAGRGETLTPDPSARADG